VTPSISFTWRIGSAFLLRGLDEFDIALEELVDELVDLDALGLGARGEIVAHLGIEVDGHLKHGILAIELTALRRNPGRCVWQCVGELDRRSDEPASRGATTDTARNDG
jgi:hypothetical protein